MASLPTIADIARRARVSTYTTSLALRNNRRVAEATRALVWKAARELGYRPNPLVSALMTRVRNRGGRATGSVIGFIISRETAIHPGQLDYQTRILKGATARAKELGYRVESIRLASVSGRGARLQEILDTRGIHGVIIAPVPSPEFTFDLAWNRLACVAVGHSFAEVPVHRVTHNHFRSMRLVLEICAARGWKRPGLMLSDRALAAVDQGYLGGYLTGSYNLHQTVLVPPLQYEDHAFGREVLWSWVKRNRVDAVLSLRHDTREWLVDGGYKVGEDIGLVMLDCNDSPGEMSGIDQRQSEMGAAAVEMLGQSMQNSQFGAPKLPRIVGLDGVWHEGHTLN